MEPQLTVRNAAITIEAVHAKAILKCLQDRLDTDIKNDPRWVDQVLISENIIEIITRVFIDTENTMLKVTDAKLTICKAEALTIYNALILNALILKTNGGMFGKAENERNEEERAIHSLFKLIQGTFMSSHKGVHFE